MNYLEKTNKDVVIKKCNDCLKQTLETIQQKFQDHPSKNNMSYKEHMKRAFGLGILSTKAATCFFIHAIIPFVFETTGSETITEINSKLKESASKDE